MIPITCDLFRLTEIYGAQLKFSGFSKEAERALSNKTDGTDLSAVRPDLKIFPKGVI